MCVYLSTSTDSLCFLLYFSFRLNDHLSCFAPREHLRDTLVIVSASQTRYWRLFIKRSTFNISSTSVHRSRRRFAISVAHLSFREDGLYCWKNDFKNNSHCCHPQEKHLLESPEVIGVLFRE